MRYVAAAHQARRGYMELPCMKLILNQHQAPEATSDFDRSNELGLGIHPRARGP